MKPIQFTRSEVFELITLLFKRWNWGEAQAEETLCLISDVMNWEYRKRRVKALQSELRYWKQAKARSGATV